jgi:ketosteroid isomerase-like protein
MAAAGSDREVEIVRRGFDAFASMDMDAFTKDWHEGLVWDVSGYDDWPGSRTSYTGAPEILQEFGNFMGSVRALEVTNLEITPLDDGRVLATYHERRINEGHTEPVHLDIGIVYEFASPDDGKIARIEVYTGHERARRAAGIA